MIIKKLFVWLIIFLLSTALIITSFVINPKKKIDNNSTIILNKTINYSDIKNITDITKLKNKYLKNIDNVDLILKNLIIENIKMNIEVKKKGLNITKKELSKTILNIDDFKINEKFSEHLYKDFLNKNKLTEFHFQSNILKNIEKTQINNGIKLIKQTYLKKFNCNYLNKKKYPSKKIYTKNYNTNININDYKIKFLNLSKKNVIKNLYKKKIKYPNNKGYDINFIELYIMKNNKIRKTKILAQNKNLDNKDTKLKNNFVIKKITFLNINTFPLKTNAINNDFKKSALKKIKYIKNESVMNTIESIEKNYNLSHIFYMETSIINNIYNNFENDFKLFNITKNADKKKYIFIN